MQYELFVKQESISEVPVCAGKGHVKWYANTGSKCFDRAVQRQSVSSAAKIWDSPRQGECCDTFNGSFTSLHHLLVEEWSKRDLSWCRSILWGDDQIGVDWNRYGCDSLGARVTHKTKGETATKLTLKSVPISPQTCQKKAALAVNQLVSAFVGY